MRFALGCTLLAFSSAAFGAAQDCTDLQVSYGDDGSTTATVPWQEKYKKAPHWNIENGDPPLSVSQAVAVALDWARAKYPGEEVHVSSISLMPYYCGNEKWWDYWVSVGPGTRAESVVVLMDGTVAPRKEAGKKK